MATAPSSVPAARGPGVYGSYVDEVLGYRQTVGGVASVYYPHGNHLYSVAALTNAAGQVVERYSYTAYGKQTITGPTGAVRAKSAVGFDRGFTGYVADNETGLLYARSRMYSPGLGRFVGRDPMGYVDGLSLYSGYFVPNSSDPLGLWTWDEVVDPGDKRLKGHAALTLYAVRLDDIQNKTDCVKVRWTNCPDCVRYDCKTSTTSVKVVVDVKTIVARGGEGDTALIQHEYVHIAIVKSWADLMRNMLMDAAGFGEACKEGESRRMAISAWNENVQWLKGKIKLQYTAEGEVYDEQTNHGTNDRQRDWNDKYGTYQ